MVSPRLPAAGAHLSYDDRVAIAVHEFAHLVENEINPDLPVWLEEGAAIYIGPHQAYDEVCQ